ncbi:TadE/TadG family type IV pilus assembly protein [Roseospira visakhapatnamensis]|uniref:Flp pilus assembly protein TadG n=1 Tax=Roseospira visakhapatnamensis TaxID=390880 RepID=A0A7W6RDC4_9PROT|nr:TadE/TadG family type IV pilus assembly protein [Roseospira visakhapatnamensis]MBB4266362.1 Flp pilus assembly protein TadG [Roseospira visakhapatnamensis]
MIDNDRTQDHLPSVWRDTRGVTAVIFGLMAIPLAIAAGMAIDLGVAYYVKARLAYAVDAAALAVGSTIASDVDLDERAENFFDANYPDGGIGSVHDILVSTQGNTITVSASATFDTFFMKIVERDTITVHADAQVVRAIRGLEVALVLDNTGSMHSNNNIGALRTASKDMVDILFGTETTHPNLFVSIVPYAASVNPGPAALGGLTSPTPPSWWPEPGDEGYVPFNHTPANLDNILDPLNGQGWKGCVIERTGADLMGDDNASGWEPYAWEPEVSNNYDITDMMNTVRYDPSEYGNDAGGPNLGCPSRIVPLTNVKSTLINNIAKLEAWNRGGTMSDLGMAWGRRVLSPAAPFTEGEPWDEPNWIKAIVLMTDGDNQFYSPSKNYNGTYNKYNNEVYSDYTGYDRLEASNPRLGTNSKSKAKNIINANLAAVCESIKQQGIVVYTVTFTSSINATTKQIYKDCATDLTKWFDSPSQEDLKNSFKAIAVELSKLRVSR